MKRFFLAFAILLGAVFTAEAQEDIPENFFKRTIGIVGVPADTLAERMNKWLATNELTAYGYKHIIGTDEILRKPRSEKSVYCSIDAPNYFRGKEDAYIIFLLTVRTFRYGASVIMDEINCMRNPILPHLWPEWCTIQRMLRLPALYCRRLNCLIIYRICLASNAPRLKPI